jgi:hypothetical protein
MNQPVAQRLLDKLRWGVNAANVGFSVAEWGDRAFIEPCWRLRGDRFRRDPFMRQAGICIPRRHWQCALMPQRACLPPEAEIATAERAAKISPARGRF